MSISLSEAEVNDVACFAKKLATEYVVRKFEGSKRPIAMRLMGGIVNGSIKTSNSGAVWITMSSPYTNVNCVTTNPSKAFYGLLIQARFDADDFVGWIEEEITEALLRMKTLSQKPSPEHDNLLTQATAKFFGRAYMGHTSPIQAVIA